MSDWAGISLEELQALIEDGLAGIDDSVRDAWEEMKLDPKKWQCSPWGDDGGGFWVVAELDDHVVWYNDIEDGFNTSLFTRRGIIDEYWCNQDSFHEFLLTLPEAKQADRWPLSLACDDPPDELAHGGFITRRQTTYWDVRDSDGLTWRCHFKRKAEVLYRENAFKRMTVADDHPTLAEHREPKKQLCISSVPRDTTAFLERLDTDIARITAGWRRLQDYMNPELDLGLGYGQLLAGPTSVVDAAAAVLSAQGVDYSIVDSWTPEVGVRALVMGRSCVIAQAFRFEKLQDA